MHVSEIREIRSAADTMLRVCAMVASNIRKNEARRSEPGGEAVGLARGSRDLKRWISMTYPWFHNMSVGAHSQNRISTTLKPNHIEFVEAAIIDAGLLIGAPANATIADVPNGESFGDKLTLAYLDMPRVQYAERLFRTINERLAEAVAGSFPFEGSDEDPHIVNHDRQHALANEEGWKRVEANLFGYNADDIFRISARADAAMTGVKMSHLHNVTAQVRLEMAAALRYSLKLGISNTDDLKVEIGDPLQGREIKNPQDDTATQPKCITVAGIMRELKAADEGRSDSGVRIWTREEGFPEPLAEVKNCKTWPRQPVLDWISKYKGITLSP